LGNEGLSNLAPPPKSSIPEGCNNKANALFNNGVTPVSRPTRVKWGSHLHAEPANGPQANMNHQLLFDMDEIVFEMQLGLYSAHDVPSTAV